MERLHVAIAVLLMPPLLAAVSALSLQLAGFM